MTELNTVYADISSTRNTAATKSLWQYDYGQILKITGLDLPEAYQVHFSNEQVCGLSITMIGDADGVLIPDELLQTGLYVYAFLYLHEGESDGETEYKITIPVSRRPQPSDEEPTPVEQSAIDQAIAALQSAVSLTNENVRITAEYAEDAEVAKDAAETSAERAEQAANNAGYMEFEINEDGHLIYTRTDAVDVDFSLIDGHLVMEVI